jgi:hypothetical protein
MHWATTWNFPRNRHHPSHCRFIDNVNHYYDIGGCKYHRKSDVDTIEIDTLWLVAYVNVVIL